MLVTRGTSLISDSRRDAEKYSKLLLALRSAKEKIGALEKTGRASIDEVLASLLPDLVEALDAAQAFVVICQSDKKEQATGFDLAAVYPEMKSGASSLPWSKWLDQVLSDGRARVVEPFEDAPQKLIHGLEIFQAVTAILVRMQVGNQSRIIGVCNRSQPEKGPFLAGDRWALESIIELIAIGLRMGERRRQELEAVINASKVITASVGLSRQEILERILEQAVETVKGSGARKATLGTMQLLDEKSKELVFECAYPPNIHTELRVELGDRLSLETRSGISVRAANSREPQLVHDVHLDPDYVEYYAKTRSELAVPLLDEGRLIGVLDVENDQVRAFDEEDVQALQALADLAVVALRNTKHAEQLARSNSIGLMGAWGAEIVHDVNREVGHIRSEVFLLAKHPSLPEEVRQGLSAIDEFARQLALPDIPEHLPGTEVVMAPASADLDSEIHAAVEVYRSDHPAISFQFEPGCPGTRVAMHERFIRSIFRNLLRNAVHALTQGDSIEKTIRIQSSMEGSMAMIEMENSGPSLRPEIVPFLFKRLFPHDDGRKGRGLLLVGFLVEQHGGRIEAVPIEAENGVHFRFWLPLFELEGNTAEA